LLFLNKQVKGCSSCRVVSSGVDPAPWPSLVEVSSRHRKVLDPRTPKQRNPKVNWLDRADEKIFI
jgi:hypothetical protein